MARAKANGSEEIEPVRLGDGFDLGDADVIDVEKPTVSLQTEGDTIAGFYCGYQIRKVQGRRARLHRFIIAGGEERDVWGSAILDSRLDSVKHGTLTHVEHVGHQKSGKGNDAKLFRVRVNPKKRASEERLSEARASMGMGEKADRRSSEIEEADIPF